MESRPSNNMFDAVPVDVITYLLSMLSDDQLAVVSKVCRKFYAYSGRKHIWAPRLFERFNVVPPANMDHRYLCKALEREEKSFSTSCVMYLLAHRLEAATRFPEEFNALDQNPSVRNIYRFARLLQLSHEDVSDLFAYVKTIFCGILSKPDGYFTENRVHEISDHANSPEEHKAFCQRFPEAVHLDLNYQNRHRYIRDYLGMLSGIGMTDHKHLICVLLLKHPDLAKITFAKRHGVSWLHQAIEGQNYDFARLLIAMGADVDKTLTYLLIQGNEDVECESPLLIAFKNLVTEPDVEKIPATVRFINDLLAAGAHIFYHCLDSDTNLETTPYDYYINLLNNHQFEDRLDLIVSPIAKITCAHMWNKIKDDIHDKLERTFANCRIL